MRPYNIFMCCFCYVVGCGFVIVKDVVCGVVEIPASGSAKVCDIDLAKLAPEGSDYLLVIRSSDEVVIELRLAYDGSVVTRIPIDGVALVSGDIVKVPLELFVFGRSGTEVKVVARIIGG